MFLTFYASLAVTHEQLRFPGNELNHIQDRINHFIKKNLKILLHYIWYSVVDNIIVEDPVLSQPNDVSRQHYKKTITRPMEYCNSFQNINSGDEGK